jgi:hypothetical protein
VENKCRIDESVRIIGIICALASVCSAVEQGGGEMVSCCPVLHCDSPIVSTEE